jgi:hypothetical protein
MTELQHAKEFLEEQNSAVVRQTLMITGDFNISWQIWHVRELLTVGSQFADLASMQKRPVPSHQNATPDGHVTPDPSQKAPVSDRWALGTSQRTMGVELTA